MSAGRFALLGLLALAGGCISAPTIVCPDLRQADDLYAVYETVSVEKYGGGLTTRVEATAFVGQQVQMSAGLFRLGDTTITQPRYETQCHRVPSEGEVSTDRWSNFFGYGIERRHIEVLDVYAPTEAHPHYRFEVIGPQELWRLYDGWLYRLRKQM